MLEIKRHGSAVRTTAAAVLLIAGGFGYAPSAVGAGRSTTISSMANAKAQVARLPSRPQQELAAIAAGRSRQQL
jgi:hypothetical protein